MNAARTWVSIVGTDLPWVEMLLGAALLLVLGVRTALHRSRVGRRLDSSLTLIASGILAAMAAAGLEAAAGGVGAAYGYAFSIAAVSIGTVRLILVLIVDFHLRERRGAAVSAIVRDVLSMVVYFLITLAVLRFSLDINLASLIATSAVLTAIVGLALQDVLSSVISGLVLELEDPFEPSDWIRVGQFEGQVVETGWRTTRIRTRVNEVITLPNTLLAREPVVNFTRPDPRYGDTLRFHAGYEIAPHAVKQAVFEVLAAEPAVLAHPEAEVRTARYDESGIEYHVRYWLDQFGELERLRDRLMTNLWYALRRAAVRVPLPARDLFVHAEAPRTDLGVGDVGAALARVPLFAPLRAEDVQRLSRHVRPLAFGPGERIVREGEAGDSFYVIARGAVAVTIGPNNGGRMRRLAELGPGDYFGEMSLLAGEPRSATVVARDEVVLLEVSRDAFQEIVAADPGLLEPISQMAARRSQDQHQRRHSEQELPPFDRDPAAQRLLQRIRSFLGL